MLPKKQKQKSKTSEKKPKKTEADTSSVSKKSESKSRTDTKSKKSESKSKKSKSESKSRTDTKSKKSKSESKKKEREKISKSAESKTGRAKRFKIHDLLAQNPEYLNQQVSGFVPTTCDSIELKPGSFVKYVAVNDEFIDGCFIITIKFDEEKKEMYFLLSRTSVLTFPFCWRLYWNPEIKIWRRREPMEVIEIVEKSIWEKIKELETRIQVLETHVRI